jgi:hypothetical protein
MTVGDRSGKIERGRAFGPQNRKPSCLGLVSVWGAQRAAGFVEEVHGEGQVRWFSLWAHAIAQELDGDTWGDEMSHLMNNIKKNNTRRTWCPPTYLSISPPPSNTLPHTILLPAVVG